MASSRVHISINTSPRVHNIIYYELLMSLAMIYHIKTHGSESRGQEEAGLRDERVSYLQVAPL